MSISSRLDPSAGNRTLRHQPGSLQSARDQDHQLYRWGGIAGLAGVVLMLGTATVVGVLGLPDASDVETLRDFPAIEAGRIAEHFLYLGALLLFALHAFVLQRVLTKTHPAAALFGAVTAAFGLVIMAASSLLHLSTSPLSDLYTAPDASSADQRAIEYSWHGAQSVFDTMLATGVLLVPFGIILFAVAMRSAPAFGTRLTWLTFGLGALGVVGATIAVIVPGSAFSAGGVLAIAAFHIGSGWRMLTLGRAPSDSVQEFEPPNSAEQRTTTGAES